MFCTQCGVEIEPQARYCSQCGKPTGAVVVRQTSRRLERSMRDKKIAGVCSGFAHYFDVDVTLMRIIWLVLIFVPPSIGVIAYLLAWLVMPKGDVEIATVQQPSAAP